MQVSHSRIECYKQCAFKYKLRYIDKAETYFKDRDASDALIIGTALHTAIETTIEEAIEWYYSQYPILTDAMVEEAIKLEVVAQLCKEVLPRGGTFELKLECDEFIGYIDYLVEVEPNVYDMYDFKYSNAQDRYRESGQLHEYKYYFEKLNPGKKIRNLYFLFAPKVAIKKKYKNKTNKRDETLEEFRIRLKEELKLQNVKLMQIEYNEEKVNEFIKSKQECLNETKFQKNVTRLCDWCEYKDYCFTGDTFNIVFNSGIKKGANEMKLPENKRRETLTSDNKKIWIYGTPFCGKTYLANQFPDPLILNTDGNIKYVDAPYIRIKDEVTVGERRTERTLAWTIFTETIAELEKKQNTFKTIIVDLLEDTYEHCRLYMYDKLKIDHESDDSFRAWDKVRLEFLSTLKRLMNLDYENIILISHEDTSKDITKKSGDKITAIKPNINDKIALKVAGMVDLVCRVVRNEDERIISFKNDHVTFGGGRVTLKYNEVPCSYENLLKAYGTAIEKPVEKVEAVKPTEEPVKVEEKPKEETLAEQLPQRKERTRTEPTEHEKKVEEFKQEHAQTETAPAEEAVEQPHRRTRRIVQ